MNMIVKKERHGRIMTAARETHHILLERKLLTLHKPTEQKRIDNETHLINGRLCI